jgi:hypothetical protein
MKIEIVYKLTDPVSNKLSTSQRPLVMHPEHGTESPKLLQRETTKHHLNVPPARDNYSIALRYSATYPLCSFQVRSAGESTLQATEDLLSVEGSTVYLGPTQCPRIKRNDGTCRHGQAHAITPCRSGPQRKFQVLISDTSKGQYGRSVQTHVVSLHTAPSTGDIDHVCRPLYTPVKRAYPTPRAIRMSLTRVPTVLRARFVSTSPDTPPDAKREIGMLSTRYNLSNVEQALVEILSQSFPQLRCWSGPLAN